MKTRNEPIGEVECPHKGCTETAKVFRFRPRNEGRKTVFSGKLYCECPKHGRIGADGNATINEYLLENAEIWTPPTGPGAPAADSKKNPAPAQTPARKAPEPTRSAPAKASEPVPVKSSWRTLIDLD